MIEVSELKKRYKTDFWKPATEALRGISLSVKEGDLFGFIGPNGAGKSTTIKTILGLLKPSSGHVSLLGQPPHHWKSRQQVGFLPEQPYFYDYLTGFELLSLYGALHGLRGKTLEKRIDEIVEKVGAKRSWLTQKLRTYSKGMMQRVGLGQALLAQPKLLILDEPMSGLDPMGRREVRELLRELNGQGMTIFYSSHVLSDVETICSRVGMIVRGEMRRQGTVSEVVASEEHSYLLSLSPDSLRSLERDPGPQIEGVARWGDRFVCEGDSPKNHLLAWLLDKRLEVVGIDFRRPSLEDVLAEEVAKESGSS